MPISDPRDRFFYPHHTPMKDTYNHTLLSGDFCSRCMVKFGTKFLKVSIKLPFAYCIILYLYVVVGLSLIIEYDHGPRYGFVVKINYIVSRLDVNLLNFQMHCTQKHFHFLAANLMQLKAPHIFISKSKKNKKNCSLHCNSTRGHKESMTYRKNSKIWDTSNNCHNCPKNRKV